jgi:hypothetical protein
MRWKWIAGGAVIGLAVGYAIFGKFMGSYLSPSDIFFAPEVGTDSDGAALFAEVLGKGLHQAIIEPIRQKLLISGAVGTVVGIIVGAIKSQGDAPNQ